MTDPRLAELHFLADVTGTEASTTASPFDGPARYGVTKRAFADLLFELFADGCLVGGGSTGRAPDSPRNPPGATEDPRARIWRANMDVYFQIDRDQGVSVHATHAGRLRLARLRDEMNRRRVRERFDILIDGRHFADDLRTRFWMAGGASVSLMMADLDNFKAVNDQVSYSRGDEAMRRYLAIVRDIASAYGGEAYRELGDETYTILPATNGERAQEAAERLRGAVHAGFAGFEPSLPPLSASIGVSTFSSFVEPETARKAVGALVKQAKSAGKNRVQIG